MPAQKLSVHWIVSGIYVSFPLNLLGDVALDFFDGIVDSVDSEKITRNQEAIAQNCQSGIQSSFPLPFA